MTSYWQGLIIAKCCFTIYLPFFTNLFFNTGLNPISFQFRNKTKKEKEGRFLKFFFGPFSSSFFEFILSPPADLTGFYFARLPRVFTSAWAPQSSSVFLHSTFVLNPPSFLFYAPINIWEGTSIRSQNTALIKQGRHPANSCEKL